MTWDEWLRFVVLPGLGAAALFALIVTLRQEWRDWRDGSW